MQCLLDLDGCLADFVKAAHMYHGIPYNYAEYPYPLNEWEIVQYTGLTDEEFWEPLDQGFWAALPWMEDGKRILATVEAHFAPEDICILTSPTLHSGCLAGKHDWIKEHLPRYSRQFLIGPAKHFCTGPDRILVDDADHNVRGYRRDGGQAVLVPRKWNDLHPHADNAVALLDAELGALGV